MHYFILSKVAVFQCEYHASTWPVGKSKIGSRDAPIYIYIYICMFAIFTVELYFNKTEAIWLISDPAR